MLADTVLLGDLMVGKADGTPFVLQLTPRQVRQMRERPDLQRAPREALAYFQQQQREEPERLGALERPDRGELERDLQRVRRAPDPSAEDKSCIGGVPPVGVP